LIATLLLAYTVGLWCGRALRRALPHACSGIGCRGLPLRATDGDSH